MKKLNVAIIGQGRSGRNIHGHYFLSDANEFYTVKYIVDADAGRRAAAERDFEGVKTFADYHELFAFDDIDLVVNATYSDLHYPITLDCLEHGYNVLTEKPFGRTRYECEHQIRVAKEKGVVLAVFQQSFFAPYYTHAKAVAESGQLGDIKQVSVCFNAFSRRWDWQTLQKKCAGGLYNTGPHPVGLALGFLDFDKETRLAFSRLDRGLTSGDGDDYAKLILTAPGKPVVDVEISSLDAYSPFTLKIQGSRGTLHTTISQYKMTWIVDGENPERPVIEGSLRDENGNPVYCREELIKHTEEGKHNGSAFDVGKQTLYRQLYYRITEGTPMAVTPEMATDVIGVISAAYEENRLDVRF